MFLSEPAEIPQIVDDYMKASRRGNCGSLTRAVMYRTMHVRLDDTA
jgi:hypothetical protein